MSTDDELREQLATCTRIFAMQGMIGVFGHVSVYQPQARRVFITPGMGSDKATLRPEQIDVPAWLAIADSCENRIPRMRAR